MAFTFCRWIDRAARIAAILGTSYLLIATSYDPPPPQVCLHERQDIRLLVQGNCGPPATITIVSHENECPIVVLNAAAAGLPSAGRFSDFDGSRTVSLRTHPWALSAYLLPDGGADNLEPHIQNVLPVSDDAEDAAVALDAGEVHADTNGDAGVTEPQDALFVPYGMSDPSSPQAQQHCKVKFLRGVPQMLTCYASAPEKSTPPTCTSTVSEIPL